MKKTCWQDFSEPRLKGATEVCSFNIRMDNTSLGIQLKGTQKSNSSLSGLFVDKILTTGAAFKVSNGKSRAADWTRSLKRESRKVRKWDFWSVWTFVAEDVFPDEFGNIGQQVVEVSSFQLHSNWIQVQSVKIGEFIAPHFYVFQNF